MDEQKSKISELFTLVQTLVQTVQEQSSSHSELRNELVQLKAKGGEQAPQVEQKADVPAASVVPSAAPAASVAAKGDLSMLAKLGAALDGNVDFNAQVLGLKDSDLDLVKKLLVAPQVDTHSSCSELLFPLDTGVDMQFSEVFAKVLQSKNQARRFGDFKKLSEAITRVLIDFIRQGDCDSSIAWLKYYNFLLSLFHSKGLEATEDYHWDLFKLVKEGEHDLVKNGPVSFTVLREVDDKFRRLGTDRHKSQLIAAASDKSGDGKQGKLYCKKHGLGKHKTADCLNPDDDKPRKQQE
jgi:hypothetical protein